MLPGTARRVIAMSTVFPEHVLAQKLVHRYGLSTSDLVIEIGCGDGSLLQALRQSGPRVLGIDADVVRVASAWASGVDSIAAYFGPGVADYVRRRYGPARLLVV